MALVLTPNQPPGALSTMDDIHLTERTALRAYRVQTVTAYIAAFGFMLNAVFAVLELFNGHLAGLPARLGVAAVTAAVWWSGSFRARMMRRRAFDARPVDLLRDPSAWLPSPFFSVAAIEGRDVQLLPADTDRFNP